MPRPPVTRRDMLLRCAQGFGAVALSSLLPSRAFGAQLVGEGTDPLTPRPTHFEPRARNVIFLYMDGGPSQVDSFDPKPRLARENGKPIGMKIPKTQFDDVGTVLQSPWEFKQHGESGTPVSSLFPHVAQHVDKLAVVRSMVSEFPEHTNANYFLHTGSGLQGRPSAGSWICYGLGSECRDLPGFVVLDGGLIPAGGLDNFNSGFLPATYQGSLFKPTGELVANVLPSEADPALQRAKLDLVGRLDRAAVSRNDAMEAAIRNYELAFRMQSSVPGIADLSGETGPTRALYGLDDDYEHTRTYGTLCLLARRLVEQGVRFIELTCPDTGHDRWDQHSGLLAGHEDNARMVDRPIAGLLTDLAARGLLEHTVVVCAGEFGRTPMAQGTDGRDHNPHGFSMWLAGAGVKGGTIHGATDEYGYYAVDGMVTIHDLHATLLHLLGLDHKRLTYRFSGRDMRLTDVHGEVVHPILS
jgi:hypothetical protein